MKMSPPVDIASLARYILSSDCRNIIVLTGAGVRYVKNGSCYCCLLLFVIIVVVVVMIVVTAAILVAVFFMFLLSLW